jgi:hypothetical protein
MAFSRDGGRLFVPRFGVRTDIIAIDTRRIRAQRREQPSRVSPPATGRLLLEGDRTLSVRDGNSCARCCSRSLPSAGSPDLPDGAHLYH